MEKKSPTNNEKEKKASTNFESSNREDEVKSIKHQEIRNSENNRPEKEKTLINFKEYLKNVLIILTKEKNIEKLLIKNKKKFFREIRKKNKEIQEYLKNYFEGKPINKIINELEFHEEDIKIIEKFAVDQETGECFYLKEN